MKTKEFEKLICSLHDIYGLDFSGYATNSLKRRVDRLLVMKKFTDIEKLSNAIRSGALSKEEFLEEVTVNVTEMFRDPTFWIALKNIIPNLFLNTKTVRIWHAGCSTGEEVFSMAILLKETGYLDKCKIVATDISDHVLEVAKAGRISLKSIEVHERNYARLELSSPLLKHFYISGPQAVLDPSLTKNISFRNLNLVSAEPFSKFDLILCRNVLIYFDHTLQDRVIRLFRDSLFNYSYFCLGVKENFSWSNQFGWFISVNEEVRIFKKIKE